MRSSVLALAVLASRLGAQADTARQSRDTAMLAPTVVTVTREPMELSRAPFAVGVATRSEIQRGKPGLALDEALAGIAGVQVDNRFNYALGERISIRGFGARAQFGVRGARVILDGIPLTLADGQTSLNSVDVADLARVEVIRGPASALHGNAAAGVIQMESDHGLAQPENAGSGAELRTVAGAHGLFRNQLSFRGVAGTSEFGASASRLSFDGYRDWNTARNDHVTARFRRAAGSGSLGIVANWVRYDALNPGGLSQAILDTNRRVAAPTNLTNRTGEDGTQGQIGVTWTRSVRNLDVQLSGHGLRRHVDNPIPGRIVVIDRDAGGARLSLSAPRVGGSSLRVSFGSELQLQNDDRRNFLNVNGSRGADTLDQGERVTNAAVFAQAALDLTPRVALTAGARYDRIRFTARDRLVDVGNPDDSGERTMSAVSPAVGLTVAAGPLLSIYSNISTSFETPTTSELANQESGAGGLNPALDPQRTTSVEVGLNGRIRAGAVAGSLQLALYSARVADALIPFEVASLPGRQYFRNAGSTRNRGVEAGATLALPMRLMLRLAASHTDARFDEYSVTSGNTTTVFDDNQVPGVAANRANATVTYQNALFFANWETQASSSIAVNDANSQRSPGYAVHGLRAGLQNVSLGALEFSPHLGVMNIFDREYNTSVVVNAFGGRFFEPGPPRSVYAGVGVSF